MDQIVILDAGPAGMACGHTLTKAKIPSLLIEKNDEAGGLCRAINFHGYFFDISEHRVLSRSEEINDLWQNIMGDDLLHVKRLSRIYYNKRYFEPTMPFGITVFPPKADLPIFGGQDLGHSIILKCSHNFFGRGGIRTPGGHKTSTVFKTVAFNRSATLPYFLITVSPPMYGLNTSGINTDPSAF